MSDANSNASDAKYSRDGSEEQPEYSVDGSEEAEYSQDVAVNAVRDYYAFLCTMYLDPSRVAEPPLGGWPEITPERFHYIYKSEVVIELLRHLPYITTTEQDHDIAHGSAHCYFADWAREARTPKMWPEQTPEEEGEAWRIGSEPYEYEDMPSSIIGLTLGGAKNDTILLDTEIGIIHWIECPNELKRNWKLYPDGRMEPYYFGSMKEEEEEEEEEGQDFQVVRHIDPEYFAHDWEVEEEREWRSRAGSWEIADFFEILKAQFRRLEYVPLSDCKVVDMGINWRDEDGMRAEVRGIWREFGWPEAAAAGGAEDKGTFAKEACLAKIKDVLNSKYNYKP